MCFECIFFIFLENAIPAANKNNVLYCLLHVGLNETTADGHMIPHDLN